MGPVETILSMFEKVIAAAGLNNELLTTSGMEVITLTAFTKRWLGKKQWQTWVVVGAICVAISFLTWWGNWFGASAGAIILFLITALLLKGVGVLGNKANAGMNKFGANPTKREG